MRNLLSEETKHEIKREYQLRLLLVLTVFLSISVIIGGISVFPSYVVSKAHESAVKSQVQFSGMILETDKQSASTIVRRTKIELKLLSELKERKPFSSWVNEIVESKPDGVAINKLVYRALGGGENSSLVINGVARAREDLLLFERDLKSVPDFVSVILPISNLAEDKDILFSIRIEGVL